MRVILTRVHLYLIQKISWYRRWHQRPYHSHVHKSSAVGFAAGALIVCAKLVVVTLLLNLSPIPALAATQTWASQSDWNGWSRSNTSSALAPGYLTLDGSSSASWAIDSSFTTNISDIWGSGPSDVWAVGPSGSIKHFDGSAWNSVNSGTTTNLLSIWGFSSSNIWATGNNGLMLHYDGSNWTSVSSGTGTTLAVIWGGAPNDIWAGGSVGALVHYNGSTWSSASSATSNIYTGIWGSSPTDVWAVAANVILHYNGSSWSTVSNPTSSTYQDLWGSSGTDVWAVGLSGAIIHYNGSSWASVSSGVATHLNGVWGSSSSDVWAVGNSGVLRHFDGSSWTAASSGTTGTFNDLWGSSSTDIWAGGASGLLRHYAASVTYVSNGTATVSFDALQGGNSWSAVTKADSANGQTLNYYVAPDTDATCPTAGAATSSSWTSNSWTALSFSGNNADLTSLTRSRYLCVGAYLATSNSAISPAIDSLSLTYTPNTVPSVASLSPASLTTGMPTNDTTPGPLTFQLSDLDGDQRQFRIQIDDSADFGSPVVDYTGALSSSASQSFTVGQSAGGGSYTVGSASTVLLEASYYWRVKAIDANGAQSSYSAANGGAVAFVIDTTAPTFSNIATVSNNSGDTSRARGGDVVTTTFTSSETIASPVVAMSAGKGMSCTNPSGNNWSCTRTLDGSESEGSNPIAISVSDLAGNNSSASSSVITDFTGPGFSGISALSNNALSNARGRVGDAVTLQFTASESLATSPAVTLGTKVMALSGHSGNNYTYMRVLDGSETEGSAAIFIGGSDVVGNTGNGSGSFITDFTAPGVPTVSSPSGAITLNAASFTVAGNAEANALVEVLRGATIVASQQLSGGASSFAIAVTLMRNSANNFMVRATDSTGNISSSAVVPAITEDSLAPHTPSIISPSSGLHTSDTTPTITASGYSDASAHGSSQWLIDNDGDFSSPLVDSGNDTAHLESYTVPSENALQDGTYYAKVRYRDIAGNNSAYTTPVSFVVDTTNPIFTSVTASTGTGFTGAKVGDTLTVTFHASETLNSHPAVSFGGQVMTFSNQTGDDFTYQRILDGSETEGSATISISGSDGADNIGTASSSSVTDYTLPVFSNVALSSDNTVNGQRARSGDTVTLTFTSSETLNTSPTVTLGTKLMTLTAQNGLDYTFSRSLNGSETEGSATVDMNGTDRAGNLGSATSSFQTDFTAPASPVVASPATAVTVNAATYAITGTAEANALVTAYAGPTLLGSQQLTGGSTLFSVSIPLAQDAVNNFTVKVTDGVGNVSTSSTVPAITEDSSAPSTPAITSPVNGTFTADNTPTLTASAFADSGSHAFSRWQFDTDSGFASPLIDTGSDAVHLTSYTSSALDDGSYFARVRFQDEAGNVSAYSSTVAFTIDTTAPPAPTDVTVERASGYGELHIAWTDPSDVNLLSLRLYRSESEGETGTLIESNLSPNVQTYTDSGLEDYREYWYSLQAVDAAGNVSSFSAQVAGTTHARATQLILAVPGQTFIASSGLTGTPSAQTAGTAFNVTVYASDAGYHVDELSSATTSLSSSDTQAVLPSPSGLSGGTTTFSVTLKTAGTPDLVVQSPGLIDGAENVPIKPDVASALTSSLVFDSGTLPINTAISLTATIKDAYGNPLQEKTAVFTSSRSGDVVTQSQELTNRAGVVTGSILSHDAGVVTVRLFIDGSELASESVEFTAVETPSPSPSPSRTPSHFPTPIASARSETTALPASTSSPLSSPTEAGSDTPSLPATPDTSANSVTNVQVEIQSPAVVSVGQAIHLNSQISGDTSAWKYLWKFPDGSYSREAAPVWIPQSPEESVLDLVVEGTSKDGQVLRGKSNRDILVIYARPRISEITQNMSEALVRGNATAGAEIAIFFYESVNASSRLFWSSADEKGDFELSVASEKLKGGAWTVTAVAIPPALHTSRYLAIITAEMDGLYKEDQNLLSPPIAAPGQKVELIFIRKEGVLLSKTTVVWLLLGVTGSLFLALIWRVCRRRLP